MRPVAFGEALSAGTRLTLFSDDKSDRFFTVFKFWMDKTSSIALALKSGIPSGHVEDGLPRRRREEGRRHLLIQVPIEEENEDRWCQPRLLRCLKKQAAKGHRRRGVSESRSGPPALTTTKLSFARGMQNRRCTLISATSREVCSMTSRCKQ